ncbi:Tyrosine/DOPA decarboxylase 5 [Morella rubra]|uniref:Tyrosine/DOPA decarboxylase 5 n=1 Tax=Morella rubra TaxID=262757 RepID=A0A6A1VQC4_9ROSI|nr:Tyrosine/DOPA decarboxylase 5 [Morella rubra]
MRGFGTENLRPWEALLLCLRQVETKRIKQMGLNGKSYVPAKKMFGFKPIFKSVLMGCPFGIYRQLDEVFMGPKMICFKLPTSFLCTGGGVLQGTTCEAILCTLVAARDQMLSRIGRENIEKLVVYGSDQTHSALQKAARIAGIHPDNFRAIETSKSRSFGLSPDSLRSSICADIEAGLVPLFLCATVGTTSTSAVDPLGSLCEVANTYGVWVHIDAAYAGSACICPEFRHFMDGVEAANSFSLNAHKWFLTTLDCCCLWVKDPGALIKSLSTTPESEAEAGGASGGGRPHLLQKFF